MLNSKQVKKILEERKHNRLVHEKKLEEIKQELMKSNHAGRNNLTNGNDCKQKSLDFQKIDLDPMDYCFESRVPVSNSLVIDILKAGGFHDYLCKRFENSEGYFSEEEAKFQMKEIFQFLLDEHEASMKPLPTQHTYKKSDYEIIDGQVVFSPNVDEELDAEKKWAMGVIYYYLVTGGRIETKTGQQQFKNGIGHWVGDHQNTLFNVMGNNHKSKTKEWATVSVETRKCIKGLIHYDPFERTLSEHINFGVKSNYECSPYDCSVLFDVTDSEADPDDTAFARGDCAKDTAMGLHQPPKRLMDIASFKTIIKGQKEEMKLLEKERAEGKKIEVTEEKIAWDNFFKSAVKQSRKKARKMNQKRNREKNKIEAIRELEINRWLKMREDGLRSIGTSSEDAYFEYATTPVPKQAWGRVDYA